MHLRTSTQSCSKVRLFQHGAYNVNQANKYTALQSIYLPIATRLLAK